MLFGNVFFTMLSGWADYEKKHLWGRYFMCGVLLCFMFGYEYSLQELIILLAHIFDELKYALNTH